MSESTRVAKSHGWGAKFLHWGTAGLLGYGYLTGIENISQLADPARFQTEIIFATILGLAFVARFFWMRNINGHTRLSENAPKWERTLSGLAHHGIYIGVGLIVLSGLAIAFGLSQPYLSGFFVSAMIGLHELSLAATAVLLGTHVVAALWHKFIRKDGIWESMLPNWRRSA